MSRIIAMLAAITAGLETATAVYDQVSAAHVPQPIPEVTPSPRPLGFVCETDSA